MYRFLCATIFYKNKQQNGTRTLCVKCNHYNRRGNRSRCRTKQQCTICTKHICQDFYVTFCVSCASDNHMNAIPSICIEKYSPIIKKTCASSSCKTKTKSSCNFCLNTFCENHLFAICTDCSPVTHPL